MVTDPPGASIATGDGLVVRGEQLEAASGLPSSHVVRVSAPGFEPADFEVRLGYRADPSLLLLLAGIVPYFFSARLDDAYRFSLRPLDG